MPVTKYQTMNGRIRRRCTYDGGVETDHVAVVTNALGSVVANYKDGCMPPGQIDRNGRACEKHSVCLRGHAYASTGGTLCNCALPMEGRRDVLRERMCSAGSQC